MSLNYATSEDDAKQRFEKYKKQDPFPSIPPSLLNGADIADYVAVTAMIHPFHEDKLKSGSYEVKLSGKCYFWGEDGVKQEIELIEEKDKFKLRPNSLVYVEVEPYFRLPDYMALRFNLSISHVHRGILLGTGPLIDPGFEGNLLIPLHNFSNNMYVLQGGEALIWVEFTKLSPILYRKDNQNDTDPVIDNNHVDRDLEVRRGIYIPFPKGKKNKNPGYYFDRASKGSSNPIPTFFSSVKEIHRETNTKIERFGGKLNFYKWSGVTAIVATVIAVVGIFIGILNPTWTLINDVYNSNDQKWQKLIDEFKVHQTSCFFP